MVINANPRGDVMYGRPYRLKLAWTDARGYTQTVYEVSEVGSDGEAHDALLKLRGWLGGPRMNGISKESF